MKILRLSVLIFTFLLLSFSQSNAQEFLVVADEVCVQGPPGSSGAVLYRVNPINAAFEEIGPIGFDGVGALAQIGDGRLIAGAKADQGNTKISLLIEINPVTGQGTLIGTSGSSDGPGCGRINDLTYDPASDTLYATGIQCDEEDGPNNDFTVRLLTINPDTGAQTIIGETGFEQVGNALAIDPSGTLFSSGCCSPTKEYYTINPNTGVATLIATGEVEQQLFNSFVFNPFNGELLGTSNLFPITNLASVNPFTGDITTIGQLPDCADGMEFFELQPRPIPTLSEWGLIAMASILGIVGLFAIRRRVVV